MTTSKNLIGWRYLTDEPSNNIYRTLAQLHAELLRTLFTSGSWHTTEERIQHTNTSTRMTHVHVH